MKLRLALLVLFASSCSRDLELPDPPPVTGFITGRVVVAVPGTSQSAPLPNATIALLSSNLHATSDERGQFLLGPLPQGTYRLFFSSKSAGTTRQRLLTGVTLKPGATNSVGDVSIQENALLTGRALIQGRPQGNVGITVFSPGTDYVTTSADNGGWLLGNLPEGSIRASAWRPGFTPATTTDITLQGGVVTSAVDMILEPEAASAPPGSIVGRVIVLGREDHAGVTVKAISAQTLEVKSFTTSEASGAFTLSSLGPDLYTLTLELAGYPSARVPNLAVAGGVQLELVEPIVMAVTGDGNVISTEPIGGPSGPLFNLDGGVTSPDGGVVTSGDGGTIGAECTDDNQCASGRLCVSNRCVGCSVNVQCRPGYSCLAGDCTRDCQANAECSGGLVCIGGSCVNCITSSDCRDPSLVCNPQTVCAPCRDRSECPAGKACLPSGCGTCGADGDCGAGAICEQGVCTAGDCHGNADCSANEACVGCNCGTCTADSQCRAGQLCVNGGCVVGNCRSVLECNAGQVCLGNQCGACAADQHCGTGQLCLPGANGLRCTAASCRVSGDCTGASAGQLCVNNQCTPCGSANLCTNGQICNAQGRCVVGDCFTNLDCTGTKAGWACLAGNCTPCGANSDCAASGYVCVSGTCRVGNCVTPADCALPGQLCQNNACIGCSSGTPCPANQVCDSDSLCHPGNCITGADCGPNQVCTNRVCSACTADNQCGLGKLCLAGACTVANCRAPSDCATGQLCLSNACAFCTSTPQCGSGQVCGTDSLCHPGNCVTATDCAPGQLCTNFACVACTADTQCGVGKLCLGGACTVANCRVPSDCGLAGQLCLANSCSFCSNTPQCGSGQVCDTDSLCHPGNCVTAANCAPGRLCVSRTCTDCTSDTQCGAGKICVNGGCVTGVCHGDADCSGGLQLCDTNPASPTAYTCRACSPLNATAGTTCGTGRVCDGAGLCRFGNCLSNTNCGATQVCTNFNCTSCTQDSQCSSGKLCVNNQCLTGNCHGTGTDPNVDCNATTNVCVNNVCTGNCRANADCAATGYCNTVSHLCTTCTGPGQCGIGKVCTPGGGGNTCVTAQCSSLEPNCPLSYSCVSGACLQLGPGTTSFDGGYVEPGTFAGNNWSPMALSGANTLYFSAHETSSPTGAGTYSVALEPDLTLRWRVRDSLVGNSKNSLAGAGIVLPAPGYPGGELFLALDGNPNPNAGAIAHRSDTGAQAWRITFPSLVPTAFATGIVNGVPMVAWGVNGSVSWMRTDGTGLRQVSLTCQAQAIAFGTKAIYEVCAEGLYVVDPITATWKLVPHGGNPLNSTGGGQLGPVATVWRPPNDFSARGFNVGTVTSDVVLYMGKVGGDVMFAVNITDDWITNSSPTTSWTLWTNTTSGYNVAPLAIDATGAIHTNSQPTLYKVNVFNGQQLTNVTNNNPLTPFTQWWNLAVNSQVIMPTGGTLRGFLLADGAVTPPAPVWTLAASPGAWRDFFPTFQTTATHGGNLLAFQNNQLGQPTLQSMPPGPSAPAFVPSWPATSLGGDSANHATAPAYECTSDAQCSATQSCLLGRCAGTCRTAATCPAGQGCGLGNCGNCTSQAACRSGEVCWVGQCIACTGAGCCNTTADCAAGNFCEGGSCRPLPASGVPGSFALPNVVTAATAGHITVAPEGTMYLGDVDGTNRPFWKMVATDGGVLATTPVVPFALGSSAGLMPMLMVASNGSGNSIWYGAGNGLYSAPASSSFSTWNIPTYPGITTMMRLAQGTSNVISAGRPTIFASAANGLANNYLFAIDAAQASASNAPSAGLLWTGVIGTTNCTLGGSGPLDHLLIGSEGTIYITCTDGSVQAWAADGDPTSGAPPLRLGLLKWRSAPPMGWGGVQIAGRAAIGKTGSGDVLYLSRGNAPGGTAILNLATASNGSLPIEVPIDSSAGLVTDGSGRAIALGGLGVATRDVAIISPTGTILFADKSTWYPSGHGLVLTADGQLIFPEYNLNPSVRRMTVVTVSNPSQVSTLFSLIGTGGLTTDGTSTPVALSTAVVPGGLLVFDHPPLTGASRTISAPTFPNNPGPMSDAWSTRFGDQQRRNSLKTAP